ncbi:MAG TPA: MucB/RseB C-terminal domain-containing protein [Burkholderiales bacterium]|nr:MucB/RseB C-terminal domain-containing protein [Burkholderiales bacterium]
MIRALVVVPALWGGLVLAQPHAAPAGAPAGAASSAPADGMTLLRRIYQATEKLSYTGTFVYQQGDRAETSRILRQAGPKGGVERVEVLDGAPREIVRTRDTVRCYLPDSHVVRVERRGTQHAFPALLPERLSELEQSYTITRGDSTRIAGYDCDSVVLAPKDDLRYGYKLWSDRKSGMLLKARTFNRKGETVEQFVFTQLSIGSVPRRQVEARPRAGNWRIEDAAVAPADLAGEGWTVGAALPGFHKVTEVTRRLGASHPVGQVVYSDGIAAVSVFIEPLAGRAHTVRPGLSTLGAFNIYTRRVADHVVTVVGETPAASVQRIGNTVEYRRPQ